MSRWEQPGWPVELGGLPRCEGGPPSRGRPCRCGGCMAIAAATVARLGPDAEGTFGGFVVAGFVAGA